MPSAPAPVDANAPRHATRVAVTSNQSTAPPTSRLFAGLRHGCAVRIVSQVWPAFGLYRLAQIGRDPPTLAGRPVKAPKNRLNFPDEHKSQDVRPSKRCELEWPRDGLRSGPLLSWLGKRGAGPFCEDDRNRTAMCVREIYRRCNVAKILCSSHCMRVNDAAISAFGPSTKSSTRCRFTVAAPNPT
jgi:hypothetical protein